MLYSDLVRFHKEPCPKKAQKLLLETGRAISKIAFDVGFEDNAYFSKQFKRISGMTPSQYRSQTTLR